MIRSFSLGRTENIPVLKNVDILFCLSSFQLFKYPFFSSEDLIRINHIMGGSYY